MRHPGFLALAVTAVAVTAVAGSAHADEYEVKFEQISSNCGERSLNYPVKATIKIQVKGNDLQVDIDRTPLMVGKPNKFF